MSILFISDLHLEEQRPDITQIFLHFLRTEATQAEALYILGDLFEVWIGDDDASAFHQTIIQALRQITDSGIPIYFLHGNRDFLIGERFAQESGCILLPDYYVVNFYGTPTLLLHGDTLCTQDQQYQQFRAQVRNRQYQEAFLQKPLQERRIIAQQMRNKSREHTQNSPENIMDVNWEEIPRLMHEHQVKLLIHGHTHRPCIQHFLLNATLASRIVLGDWEWRSNILKYNPNNQRFKFLDNH